MSTGERNTAKPHFLVRSLPFFAWLAGGIGGISIDFDHFLYQVTLGQFPWAVFHSGLVALGITIIFAGCLFALVGRYTVLVLKTSLRKQIITARTDARPRANSGVPLIRTANEKRT